VKLNLKNPVKRAAFNKQFHIANTENYRLLVLAFGIGSIVGILGSGFRLTLGYLENYRNVIQISAQAGNLVHICFIVLGAICAIALSLYLIKKYAPEASGSGIQEIEGALDNVRPVRWKRVIPIKFIASILSLGSGLLLGREGPTIQIGANIGRMVKDLTQQPDVEDNSLISAGASAGLSVAFNAPLSGILFVIEEMHEHFKFTFFSVATIMIGAGTGDFVSRLILGDNPEFMLQSFAAPLLKEYWLFSVLGVVFGVIGLVFNKMLIAGMNFVQHYLKSRILPVALISGLLIAGVGILNPQLIGGGYDLINSVFTDSPGFVVLFFLFSVRFLLSIFSYSTGTAGGIFLPLLTLGALLGMLMGICFNTLFPDLGINPLSFAIAGMAAIFAATIRAPLTGLVLAVEMTANYGMMLPLIITSVSASIITVLVGNEPLYATLLRRILTNKGAAKL